MKVFEGSIRRLMGAGKPAATADPEKQEEVRKAPVIGEGDEGFPLAGGLLGVDSQARQEREQRRSVRDLNLDFDW